jgi:hypothetical protein
MEEMSGNQPYPRTLQTIEEEYLRSGKGLTLIHKE